MAVILKNDEKIQSIVEALSVDYTRKEFINCFIEVHPKDGDLDPKELPIMGAAQSEANLILCLSPGNTCSTR